MKKIKKSIILFVVFIVGVILGGTCVSYLDDHLITRYFKAITRCNIVRPHGTLYFLRQNDIATVIEMQENKLDTGLFSLTGEEKQDWTADDYLMLKKIRAYRTKYPRKNKDPEFEKAINNLLFPN